MGFLHGDKGGHSRPLFPSPKGTQKQNSRRSFQWADERKTPPVAQVKCDASRPFCTPCLKSSRGDTSAALSRCKYEGVTVAAAREAVAAARGGVTTGHAKGRKRKSEMMAAAAAAAAAAASAGGGAGEEGGGEGDNLAATTTTTTTATAKKISRGRRSSSGGQGQVQDGHDSKRFRVNKDTELLSPPTATSRSAGPSNSGSGSGSGSGSASSSSSSSPFLSPALLPPPPPLPQQQHGSALSSSSAQTFQSSAAGAGAGREAGYPPPPGLVGGGQLPNANANGESITNGGGGNRWPLGAAAAVAHHLESGVDYRPQHYHQHQATTAAYPHQQQQQRNGAGPYNVSISIPPRAGGGGAGGGYNPDVYHQHQQHVQHPQQQSPYQYHQQQQQRTATTEAGAAGREQSADRAADGRIVGESFVSSFLSSVPAILFSLSRRAIIDAFLSFETLARKRGFDHDECIGLTPAVLFCVCRLRFYVGTLEEQEHRAAPSTNRTSHYDGRSVPYTFPAAAAAAAPAPATAATTLSALLPSVSSASSSYSHPYAAASSSLFNSNNSPSSVPVSAAAYTSSAHSFAGAGSPAYAQLQLQQQQQQAGYGSSSGGPGGGSLTPGSYPPMQLAPPPSGSADVASPSGLSHEQKGRGLSALSAAAAAGLGAVVAMAEEEGQHEQEGGKDVLPAQRRGGSSSLSSSHPHHAYSNTYPTSSSSSSYAYPYSTATAPNISRSASPATWAAGITTTASGSPLHFSNLRQQVSTYPRRGSEPDAYALSSPRGAAVSAIRGEQPTRPSYSYQPGSEEGPTVVTSGIQSTTTVVSTPSNGEVSASGTTQATTPPLLGGSNGSSSSPQFKSAGGNANNHSTMVGIGAMSGSAESIGQGHANANGSGTTLPEPSAAEAAAESASYLLDEFSLTPELYQILHPQYPLSLPPLSTLHHLLTTFFLRATIPSTMLSRAQILQSLVFGPADARWPEEALLHAMCAYAASFVSPDSLAGPNAHDDPMASSLLGGFDGGLSGVYARRSTYWEMEGDKNPREYHYRHAKRCILEAMGGVALPSGHRVAKRRNLLQVRWSSFQNGDWCSLQECSQLTLFSSRAAGSPSDHLDLLLGVPTGQPTGRLDFCGTLHSTRDPARVEPPPRVGFQREPDRAARRGLGDADPPRPEARVARAGERPRGALGAECHVLDGVHDRPVRECHHRLVHVAG